MGYNRGGGLVHFLCFARNESTLIQTLHCLFLLNLPQRMAWRLTGAQQNVAQRALQTVQVLSDKIGRQLVAEIIKVQADSLVVRRQADQQILGIPCAILCAQDQAFAGYLWKQQNLRPAKTAQTKLKAMKGLVARIK